MGSAFDTLSAALHDRYRLDRELGQGGMATVYLAHDLKHDRDVALKVVRPELAATVGPERFQQEIRLAARLQHPHILTVFDSGEAAGQLWFTMPYVDGETLRVRLDRVKQLPLEEALRVAGEVAAALTYAHARGVVHRDIKPENILFEGGEAVIADFGIARALDAAGAGLTETGLAIGTPSYMSPEQASGERIVDGRSDIYSLGSVLYEMLAGEPPFTGPTAQAIIAKRLSAPIPSVRHVRDSVPHGVDAAIQRALARAPADRFQTAAEFAAALSEGRSESLPPAQARPAGRRSAWIAAGTLVALLLAVLGWRWWRCRDGSCGIPLDPRALAILPFQVSGDSGSAALREGLVTLLSLNLDGVGSLRTIHPRTVLSRWERTLAAGREPNEATLLTVGRSLGAGQILSGSAVTVGPHLRLVGELYDGKTGSRQRVDVQGAPDSLSQLVDRLSVALIRLGLGGDTSAASRVNLAGLTTGSVEALKAYVSGEEKFRRGYPGPAKADFERAVHADSEFALADYRLFASIGWNGSPHFPAWPAEANRLLPRLGRLPLRDALLIRGEWELGAAWTGSFATLEELTRRYPDDAEAWFLLGDAYYHLGPPAFIPPERFRAALRRAVELDPKFAPAYIHLIEDAFDRLDSLDAGRLVRALSAIDSLSPKAVGTRIAYGLAWGSSAERRQAEAMLQTADGDALLVAKHSTNLVPDLAEQTSRVANAIRSSKRIPAEIRASGISGLGMAKVLEGKLRENTEVLSALFKLQDSLYGNTPFALQTTLTLIASGRSLSYGYPTKGALDKSPVSWSGDVQALDRGTLYGIGVRAARLGLHREAEWAIRALTSRAASLRAGPDSLSQAQLLRDQATHRAYAQAIRARIELAAGDTARGTADLKEAADSLRVQDRGISDADFELGRLAFAAGRYQEAAKYFSTFHGFYADIDGVVPAEYFLGQAAEAQGLRDQARYHYDRFVRWWKDCDPELKPWREEGRKALARVSGEPRKD